MARISKYPLDHKFLDLINAEFIQFFISISMTGAVHDFLLDFLTPTELTMLSKRFTIAILLKRGYTAELIKNRLKVSNSAIMGVNSWLKSPRAGTQKSLEEHNNKAYFIAFIDKIEALIDKLPPAKYRNWSMVGKEKSARQISRELKSRLR